MCNRKHIRTFLTSVVLLFSINCKVQNGTIYVLIWTFEENQKWNYRNLDNEEGYVAFVSRNCTFQNCYLTTNRTYFKSALNFDVLMFNALHLTYYQMRYMPTQRSPSQLYVLFSVEPAAFLPVPDTFNGIFNLTWTYKLKSDIVHPYFLIKNNKSEIVGPKIDVDWLDINDMLPTDPSIDQIIKSKTIAAMWVVSNCASRRRNTFAQSLKAELYKYGLRVDTYGICGDQGHCKKNQSQGGGLLNNNCYSKIKSDYYFYFAFENSFTEDYVTEKVLHALLHFSVPIVFGGANYRRFLPDGIYLNAMELGVEGLALEMVNIISDTQRYVDFFKWHNHYSFHDTDADDYRESVCAFCAFLNNEAKKNKTNVYENITGWWNDPDPDVFPKIGHPKVAKGQNHSYFQSSVVSPLEITTGNTISKIIDFVLEFD